MGEQEKLVKSKRRVADHGEVFTPRWLVDDMLDLVKGETERIDSRFRKPARGLGDSHGDALTQRGSYAGTASDAPEEHDTVIPVREHPGLTVKETANGN